MTDAEHRAADAVRLLQANGIAFRWCTPFHLKAGPVNFWPARGRVHVDGEAARRPGEGVAVFHRALTDLGPLRAAVRAPVQAVSGAPRTPLAKLVPRSVQVFPPLWSSYTSRVCDGFVRPRTMRGRQGVAVVAASAALTVHFEANDLFVLAHVEDLASFDEAQRTLAARPRLSFDKARAWLLCPGREPRLLCPSDNDEYGRWPAGADRSSREDCQAAQLSMPDFMALNPDAARFRITWAAVTEWEMDASGRFTRLIASASGSIDTLAPG